MAVRNEASGSPPASSAARIIAPLSLLAVTLLVVIVVAASIGDQGDVGGGERSGDGRERTGATKTERPPKRYVVQPNDSLVAIADEFGLTVEEIQRLNPGTDPQALVTGQELKLR